MFFMNLFLVFASTVSKTNDGYVDTQSAGISAYGPSGKLRRKVETKQLAHIKFPDVRADCSGIDWHMGSFSFIDGQGLIQFIKNIGSQSAAYAFNLALETMSPQINGVLKDLSNKLNNVNLANINSCEAAAALVGSVAPRQEKIQHHTCRLLGTESSQITDFVAAHRGCGKGGDSKDSVAQKAEDKLKGNMGGDFNVAWEVLKKHPSWPHQLKETIMSLTGTVIVKGGKHHPYPPLGLNDKFFEAFATGGTTQVYRCVGDQDKCLNIETVDRVLTTDETHLAQVERIIRNIEGKIYSDVPLIEEEKNLVNSCQFPIYRVINVTSASNKSYSPIELNQYAKIIAHDVLNSKFKEIIAIVEVLASMLQNSQMNAEPLMKYMEQVRVVQRRLNQISFEIGRQVKEIFAILDRIEATERAIFSEALVGG